MNLSVIIVAAGKGLRMGAELPKQFLSFSSTPILMLTIEKFYQVLPDAELIVALGADHVEYWRELCCEHNFKIPHKIVIGGDTRFETVRNSVCEVAEDSEYVLIHDGVRPFVSSELIGRIVERVKIYGAVVPAVEVTDSIRKISSPETSEFVDRRGLVAVQTPQAFTKDMLVIGYQTESKTSFTDDASVVESVGFRVAVVDGERSNIKITTKEDMNYGKFLSKMVDN